MSGVLGPFKVKHAVAPGDLIMANTDLTQAGTIIGSPAIVPREGYESGGVISHHLFAVRVGDAELLPWLYQAFRQDHFREYVRGVASGTTVLGFRPNDLLAYRVVCPRPETYREFGALANNFSHIGENLATAIHQLTSFRDLLLPKLVSGQIDVSQLDLDAVVGSVA